MPKPKKDAKREKRIESEIVVDAYDSDERAMGWYGYLEEKLSSSFTATCIAERAISPLCKGDKVEIYGMAPEDECRHEIFVETKWAPRNLAIPLSQIKPISDTEEEIREAVADWHYWVKQGYEF
jgi:hypothetical protein